MHQKLQRRSKEPEVEARKRRSSVNDDDDIDNEIKRLEAELARDSDSEESSSDDSDDEREANNDSNERRKRTRFGETTILNPHDVENEKLKDEKEGILSFSQCASDTIVPLPKTALPTSKTKKLKIDRGDDPSVSDRKRRKVSRSGETCKPVLSDGLRDAVKEVLSGYVARSSEKIPFYCRFCSHQSKNQEDFITHKQSDFHKAAVEVERKATYCKLCRKQLTSIVQMQEHLKSKPHRDRMDQVKMRQRGGSGNMRNDRWGGRGRGSFRGRGRSGQGPPSGSWHRRTGGNNGRSGQYNGSDSRDRRQWG